MKRPMDLVRSDEERRKYQDRARLQDGTDEDAKWKRALSEAGGSSERTRPKVSVTTGELQDGV